MQKLQYPPPGSAPATVVLPARAESHPTKIVLIEYDAHSFIEKEVTNIDDLSESVGNHKVTWINVAGLDKSSGFIPWRSPTYSLWTSART
jgi:hypothetical protein